MGILDYYSENRLNPSRKRNSIHLETGNKKTFPLTINKPKVLSMCE